MTGDSDSPNSMPAEVAEAPPSLREGDTWLLDQLPDGVLIVRSDGRIVGANRAFLALTRRNSWEVVGQPIDRLVVDEDMLRLIGFDAIFGAAATRDSHVIFRGPNGEPCPLLVSSIRADHGLTFLSTRGLDRVQRELEETSRWAAVEQARADEVARARDALASKNQALRLAQDELSRAYRKLQGESVARARLEQDLRLAQKLEAIGQLSAGLAHEINTPMQYLGDNLDFLRRSFQRTLEYVTLLEQELAPEEGAPAPSRARVEELSTRLRFDFWVEQIPKALAASQDGVEQVSKIVGAMKSFACADAGEKKPSDVNQALRDTLLVAQGEYREIAAVELDLAELPLVSCYIGRLNQVFLNLVVNAAHAIADAKRADPGTIRVQSRLRGADVEVTISDNGCGIADEIRDRIFDQFFTTKAVGRGSGQGLSLSRNIVVHGHGGEISFTSTPGVGSVFAVRLPIDGAGKDPETA